MLLHALYEQLQTAEVIARRRAFKYYCTKQVDGKEVEVDFSSGTGDEKEIILYTRTNLVAFTAKSRRAHVRTMRVTAGGVAQHTEEMMYDFLNTVMPVSMHMFDD